MSVASRITALFCLGLFLELAAADPAHSQERKPLGNRALYEAVLDYSLSGGCKTRREIYGEQLAEGCEKGDWFAGTKWFVNAYLARLGREGLLALCEKHNITDCFEPNAKSDGKQILSLERELRVPNMRDYRRWSLAPGGRTMLATSYSRERQAPILHFYDLEEGAFTGQTIELTGTRASSVYGSVFSPDGAYAAARLYGPWSKDRIAYAVVSLAELRPVLVIGEKKDECKFGHAMVFSADSKSLWINCEAFKFRNTFLAAMKINIAAGRVEKRVTLNAPVPHQLSRFQFQKLARHDKEIVLVGTSESFGPDDERYNDHTRELTSILAFDLESGRSYFKPITFPIAEKSGYSINALVTAHNNDLSRIVLNISRHPLNVGNGKLQQSTKSVEVWNTRTSIKEHTLWSGSIKINDASSFGAFAGLGKTNWLLTYRRTEGSRRLSIGVYDFDSGKMLQEYGPLKSHETMTINQSGTRFVFVGKSELQVFNVAGDR